MDEGAGTSILFFSFFSSHGPNVNVDGGVVAAELIGEPQGVGSGVALLHCPDHQGGLTLRGLHPVPLVPVGYAASRGDPLDQGRRVSRERCRQGQRFSRLCADVERKSLDLWRSAWEREEEEKGGVSS